MMNSHSPSSSTPLEPCRVVPYMNVPALRGLTLPPSLSNYDHISTATFSQHGTAFSAFDPAFITAAHQVNKNLNCSNCNNRIKKNVLFEKILNVNLDF